MPKLITKTERFEFRTIPSTYLWLRNYAQSQGILWGGKGSVSNLLVAIKNGDFIISPPNQTKIIQFNSIDKVWFRCRTPDGTLDWFKNTAMEFNYIYANQGSAKQLLEAITIGELLIRKNK